MNLRPTKPSRPEESLTLWIHKDTLGLPSHHLVVKPDGRILRTTQEPSPRFLGFGTQEFDLFSKVMGIPIPEYPQSSRLKTFQSILFEKTPKRIPWALALPPEAFKRSVEVLGSQLRVSHGNLDVGYFENHFQETTKPLVDLGLLKVDWMTWKYHQDKQPGGVVLESFKPKDGSGFCSSVVEYGRVHTRTGRLKVLSGPSVLLLPKDQRNVLTSRFGKGKGRLWSLDLVSLEPRVLRFLGSILNGSSSISNIKEYKGPHKLGGAAYGYPPQPKPEDPQDLYQEVLTGMGSSNLINREHVKLVVLKQIYGAGYNTLLESLGDLSDAHGFIQHVNEWFGIKDVQKRLLEEWEQNDRKSIDSLYGRRIDCTDIKPYVLLNRLIQSSAVDVALYAFKKITQAIKNSSDIKDKVIPLFILHDALIADVSNEVTQDQIKDLCHTGSQGIPLFENFVFPIKASLF